MDIFLENWPLFWLLVIAVTVVPVVVIVATWRGIEAAHVQRLKREGRTVTSCVSDLGINTGDLGESSYWIEISGIDEVKSTRVYEYDQYKHLRKGSAIRVTYLPGKPGSARVFR
jgi:hypothetical protein